MREIFEPIRSLYKFSQPCEELADHIEFFSESVPESYPLFTGNQHFTVEMFPSWTPTMYINLGHPYKMSLGAREYTVDSTEDVLILRDTNVVRYNHPGDHIFTVKFYPGGLEAVLGISQLFIRQRVTDLKTVLTPELLYKLKSLSRFDERVRLLENFFLCNYKNKKPDHYLNFISNTILQYDQHNMQLNINQLAEKQFTTSKTINRYFKRVIGTSPKNYFFLFRARIALNAYMTNKGSFNPELFGYYDGSHFYKDVRRFTGQGLADIAK